jgi:hypothetical protein
LIQTNTGSDAIPFATRASTMYRDLLCIAAALRRSSQLPLAELAPGTRLRYAQMRVRLILI